MSEIYFPIRHNLIAALPLFCLVKPLARPRARYHVAGVYTPLENQKELREALSTYESLMVSHPVIIDTYINLKRAKSSKLDYPIGKNHGDEDNLRKAICDALVAKEILVDDSLILGGQNYKLFGPEDLCLIQIWSVTQSTGSIDVIPA